MQEEIWKDIPGYEGLYQVSNLGRVYSLPKEWCSGQGNFTIRKHNGKILKPAITRGYLNVVLMKNNLRKTLRVHKLVAIAFLNHIPCKLNLVVDHINNNSTDNRLENLQLITSRKNSSKDRKNKTSKYTGVCWDNRSNKWHSSILINNVKKTLGLFTDEYEAHLAYQNKLKEL